MSVVCIVTNLLIKEEFLEVEGKYKNSNLLLVAGSLRDCYMLRLAIGGREVVLNASRCWCVGIKVNYIIYWWDFWDNAWSQQGTQPWAFLVVAWIRILCFPNCMIDCACGERQKTVLMQMNRSKHIAGCWEGTIIQGKLWLSADEGVWDK